MSRTTAGSLRYSLIAAESCAEYTIEGAAGRGVCAAADATKKKKAKIRMGKIVSGGREGMSDSMMHNGIEPSRKENVQCSTSNVQSRTPDAVAHIYVHIPFCARICPYCAFYKERADSSQTQRFCEALLREVDERRACVRLGPETIFIGGGTPTALTTAQLGYLLGGFRDRFDLSAMYEWTVEANPGSVSPRKAESLRNLGVTRI